MCHTTLASDGGTIEGKNERKGCNSESFIEISFFRFFSLLYFALLTRRFLFTLASFSTDKVLFGDTVYDTGA